MPIISKLRNLDVFERFLIFVTLLTLGNLTRLLLFRKIDYLFVDDWVIFKDFNASSNGINTTNLAPYNGHSLIVTRVLFTLITQKFRIQIPTFSIILTISLLITVFCMIRFIKRNTAECNIVTTSLTIVIVCINLNQYQNLTMPICWSWEICFIMLIWTYLIMNQELNTYRGILLLVFCFVGPLTLSLGFIIPGILILKVFYEMYLGSRSLKRIFFLLGIVICAAFAYNTAIIHSQSGYGGFSNPIRIITSPVETLIFLFTSMGSPFTPASRFSVPIASLFGLFILIFLAKVLKKTKDMKLFFLNDALITMGAMFHIIHLFGRYNGSWESISIAAQPRYSTGATLLVLGVFLNLIRNKRKNVKLILFVMLGAITLSGAKTAEDFSSVRHAESVKIKMCISEMSLSSTQCDKLLYPGEKILSRTKFKEALGYLEMYSSKI